jgi:hypothetical protein
VFEIQLPIKPVLVMDGSGRPPEGERAAGHGSLKDGKISVQLESSASAASAAS